MSIQGLDILFHPKSVAVIGASNRPDSLGSTVMRNLLRGDYEGPVMPVNPRAQSVLRVLCYPSIEALPIDPELAVICTPPRTLPAILESLGKRGCRVAMILSVAPKDSGGAASQAFEAELLETAKSYGMRLLGAGSTGIQVPGIGLNASWIPAAAQTGKLALIAQSGALASGVLDWASARGVGFSHVVSAGDAMDIDLGDLLDYLALDYRTRAILLYIRDIRDARKFLSASRAVSRIKPVIAIKANRRTGAAIDEQDPDDLIEFTDDVYDAAFRRSGMLRVHSTDELFDAVETLSVGKALRGERLAIICNGSGPGEIAADTLVAGGGKLARFDEDTLKQLSVLSSDQPGAQTPVDIGRDADAERYGKTVQVLLKAPNVDGVLVMHTPTPLAPALKVAQAVVKATSNTYRNVLACWLGQSGQDPVIHKTFGAAKVPLYATPDKAARAFLHLVDYRRNQDTLLQTPAATPLADASQRGAAKAMIAEAIEVGEQCFDEARTAMVLRAYGLDMPETLIANDAESAVQAAEAIGWPVSLRLRSPTVTRQKSVGNMALDLGSSEAVKAAAEGMATRFAERYAGEDFPGFVVQAMVHRPGATVMKAGVAMDPLFGPVIRFGPGGSTTTVRRDHAVALPPLNMNLAKELIARTRVGEVLATEAGRTAINQASLRRALVLIADLLVDLENLTALSIDPLLVDAERVTVIDARIGLKPPASGERFLAIRPYPKELEEVHQIKDGRKLLVRPIRPEDEPAYQAMLESVEAEDLRLRFHGDIASLPKTTLAQLIHIDYDREMAFVAMHQTENGEVECLGTVNINTLPDKSACEYGIIVRSDMKGQGLGKFLMEKILRYCRSRKIGEIYGLVLSDNHGMIGLCEKLGFHTQIVDEDDFVEMRMDLTQEVPPEFESPEKQSA